MAADGFGTMVGNTPLIKLEYLSSRCGCELYAKAEYMNPAGSIKDRVAVRMIEMAIKRGDIEDDTVIIEATSGNTGIALAAVCADMGLKLTIVMPESMSPERRRIMSHLGADVVLTSAEAGMPGAVKEAKKLARSFAKSFLTDQFGNPDNPDAHFSGTGQEIVQELGDKKADIFVAGVGTGGTITGITRALRSVYPELRSFAVEPARSAVLNGKEAGSHAIEGIGAGFVPDILDLDLIDETLCITDEEAFEYAREAAVQAGLLVGISSGANLAAAEKLAMLPGNRASVIVTVLPDGAERYLSGMLLSG